MLTHTECKEGVTTPCFDNGAYRVLYLQFTDQTARDEWFKVLEIEVSIVFFPVLLRLRARFFPQHLACYF